MFCWSTLELLRIEWWYMIVFPVLSAHRFATYSWLCILILLSLNQCPLNDCMDTPQWLQWHTPFHHKNLQLRYTVVYVKINNDGCMFSTVKKYYDPNEHLKLNCFGLVFCSVYKVPIRVECKTTGPLFQGFAKNWITIVLF